MLQIWFELCRRHGIRELLVNLHSHGDTVRQFIQNHKGNLNVQLFEERTLLGSAGTIRANRDWVESESAFWIFYADVLTTADLGDMLKLHRERNQVATIGVYEVADPTRCGIVRLDKDSVVQDFIEKPKTPVSNLAFSGLMLGTPRLVEEIPDKCPADFGFDVLPRIVSRTVGYRIREFLTDIGTLETYRDAQINWPGPSQNLAKRSVQC